MALGTPRTTSINAASVALLPHEQTSFPAGLSVGYCIKKKEQSERMLHYGLRFTQSFFCFH
jgi:hypothetical protein